MNNLKMINDKFGHALGDQAIQMVARVLVQHTRMNDRVYRMGGDEFLVVMRNANAFELEDRLHQVDTILQRTRLGRYEAELEITIAWGATEFNGANQIDLQSGLRTSRCTRARSNANHCNVVFPLTPFGLTVNST